MRNSNHRIYKLGKDNIKEPINYDHLGLKNNCLWDNRERTDEKISKGRKALNAASGLGLKPGGLSIKACGLLFWSMVIPIITFASELWVMDEYDVSKLENFQVYSGRRVQRFHQSSPRETSYVGLGWIRIEYFIYVKKLLFIRTIAVLKENSLYRKIFVERYATYLEDKTSANVNKYKSPTFDILRIAEYFGILNEVGSILAGTLFFTKKQWKDLIWSKAWCIERQDWCFRHILFKATCYLKIVLEPSYMLIWWELCDIYPVLIPYCETMVKLICGASSLKSDNYQYRSDNTRRVYCDLCQNLAIEDIEHLIMQCPYLQDIRTKMFEDLSSVAIEYRTQVYNTGENIFHILLGKIPTRFDPEFTYKFMRIVCICVHKMYCTVISNRVGVG